MSEPLLSVRNLETYYGPVNAIKGVSLDVPEGRIVAVLGANGAGKTTLLKTIAGVANWRLARDSAKQQMKHLGWQRLDKLYDWLLEIDSGMKGGNPLPDKMQMERLIVRLARGRGQ